MPFFVGSTNIFGVMENHEGNLLSNGWGKIVLCTIRGIYYKFEIVSKIFKSCMSVGKLVLVYGLVGLRKQNGKRKEEGWQVSPGSPS